MSLPMYLDDSAFETAFRSCTLAPQLFDHEAHLRLAWIHLSRYGQETAINNICRQLYRYTDSLGAADKFNKTVTVAAIKAVHHFMGKSVSDNFPDFVREFPRLKTNFKDLLACHYGEVDIFRSEEAKREYIEPQLLPFD